LKTLWLFKIPQINSFNVLKDLNQLESIRIYPNVVGVVNDDYYPLIDKFKELNQLEDIKHWSKLNAYLDGSFIPTSSTADEETELKQILANSNIMSWTEKLENGLDIYTEDNCAKAQSILSNLVRQLENNPDSSTVTKIDCIKTAVLEFNGLDDELEGFIETGEREDLCEIFDNIADVVGIDVQDYEDGIASEWRAW